MSFISLNKFRRGKLLRLMVAQDGKCFYCQGLMLQPTVDHFVPRSKGGMGRISNIVLACRECNGDKSGRAPEPEEIARRREITGRATSLRLKKAVKRIESILGRIEAARRQVA